MDVSFDPGNWILKYVTEVAPTGVEDVDVPTALALSAPGRAAGGSATLSYALPAEGHVELAVFDVAGHRVATLVDGFVPAGTHELSWSPDVASGVYFARLVQGGDSVSRKLVMVK
jgi:hypothetical protein